MTQQRKKPSLAVAGSRSRGVRGSGPDPASIEGSRPLSARSIVASTLLGVEPPRLPSRLLVRSGELFGISDGTTRVALSRMVASGELELDDGWYALTGRLLERHARQRASRRGSPPSSAGAWTMAVVVAEGRDAAARSALRDAMRQLDMGELREGVWLRPDNLSDDRAPAAAAVADRQCRWFTATPSAFGLSGEIDAAELATQLWDLDGWARTARALQGAMASDVGSLEAGDTGAIASSFVTSASVLRHFLADPKLPEALLPPEWPGAALRSDFDRYDTAFKTLWRDWFRAQT